MSEENNNDTGTSTEDTTGLKNKNAELIRKLKDAEKRLTAAEEAAADAAENARAESGTELDKANRRIAKLEKEAADATARAEKSENGLRDYKATSALTAAIASANVDSVHVGMLTKAMRADIEYDADGEPTIEGQAIGSYLKSYFANEGKSYVRAADHNGGGATGGSATKAPRMTKENFNYTEFAKIQLENPAEANAIAIAVGKPNLTTQL